MKLKKIIAITLSTIMATGVLASCGEKDNNQKVEDTQKTTDTTETADANNSPYAEYGLDENLKFTEMRKITVEVYDRGNDGGTTPDNNPYTDFIKAGMLADHNVEVEFVTVPRWTEVEELNNLLAANNAPDICVTYSYPTIQTYANMGGVLDLSEYVYNKEILPNLWELLGETNINWNKDPDSGTIWAIEALLRHNPRVNTFVRADWLDTLNLEAPTSTKEFEEMLVAFKENADLLLGSDANMMIPFSMSYDIGWRANNLFASLSPVNYSEKERYINGFDDRHFLYEGTKEGTALLNKWYNDGLIWNEFALYGPGDKTEDNYLKAGYIGAFMHNWDYPYRNADDSIHASLKRLVSEEAAYVAVDTFENTNGEYTKYLAGPIDRKIFFPATNDEPIASLLYLDWLSKLENRMYLQIGEEGVTHEVNEDGSISIIPNSGDYIMNSGQNIDYTIVINGLDLGDSELTTKSIATSYAGVGSEYVEKAYNIALNDKIVSKNVNVGEITSEMGLGPALADKRDTILVNSVVTSSDKFDSVWESGMQDYLGSGGQAIINERSEKWTEFFGDSDSIIE